MRWILLAAIVAGLGCVRGVTVCVEASHTRPSPDWQRNDAVGASVCTEHGPK